MKGHILYCTEWPQDRADVVVQCGITVPSARAVAKVDYAARNQWVNWWIDIVANFDVRNICRACRKAPVPPGLQYEAIMVSGEDYMTLESQRADVPITERT